MNKTKAFIRIYKYEFFAFVANVVTAIFSFLLTSPGIAFALTIAVFTISIFVVIYFKTRGRDFYFLPLDKPGDEKDWVGRGRFAYVRNENCFEVTDSHAGYIFPKTSNWDDYKFECEFKIVNMSLGCIVRAVNLSNYVMYQLFYDRIKPHLRINGEWIVMEENKFEEKLKPDKWYGLVIICEKRSIRIAIKEADTTLFDRHFIIPPQMGVVYREIDSKGEETKRETRLMQNIDFDFGSVGVRNHGDERAFVKNIYLEKL